MARQLKSPLVLHSVAQQIYERARARYGDDAPSSMPAKLMEEDTGVSGAPLGLMGQTHIFTFPQFILGWCCVRYRGSQVKLQAPGFEGFTYQDRTSNWDRPLKGGKWVPRSKL